MSPTPLFERIAENPFYVLGLPTTCTRQEVEREGQKLLSMLQLNLREALEYQTPLGLKTRTAELVRHAMNELRDPQRRLAHELFAALPAKPLEVSRAPTGPRALRWGTALSALSLGPKRGLR